MENSECLRDKWRDEFGDAPFPSVFSGRDDISALSTSSLHAVLQVTSERLSRLKQELRQHEFIKEYIQNVIREREEKEKSERDDKFINEYVYSFVGKDKRCSNPPFPSDPDFLGPRCDSDCVTFDSKQDYSSRRVNGRAFLTGQHSLDHNLHGIKDISFSHSRADNSVKTKPPIPVTTQTVTIVDYDSPDSEYGRVWIVPSKQKSELSKRFSTGMMSSSQVSKTPMKQPPPVPKKPNKPQPAPRLSLGLSRSNSSELSPEGAVLSEAGSKCSSLPRNAALNSTTIATSIDNTPARFCDGETGDTTSTVTPGCAKSLTSKHSSGLEYTNSKLDMTEAERDRHSVELSAGETERGVQDLVAASIETAVNINNSLTQVTCKEPESSECCDSEETDMKKLYRTKSDRNKLDMGDGLLQGTYRKLSDDELPTVSIKTDDDVVMRVHKDARRSDISTSSSDSTGTLTDGETGRHRSHHRAPSYENWTIDRCLTRHDDSNDSDESEAVYDNMVFGDVSPASTLQKYSYKGSKDSGLADDLSTNESSPSVSDSVSVTTEESANDGVTDRVKAVTTSDDDDDDGDNGECVDVLDSSEGDDRNADNVSVASDFEYMRELPAHTDDQTDGRSRDSLPEGPSVQVAPQVKQVTIESPPSSSEEEPSFEEPDVPHELSPRDKLLQMRQLIVKGILESEKSYLHILDLLINYRKSLEASSRSSKPVISEEDTNTIFSNIEVLYKIHEQFVNELEPKVKKSSPDQQIGECFKMMVFKFPEFGKYMENYQKAVSTIHKCSQENPRFEDIAEKVTFSSQAKEVTNLEDALFKPVQRVQRNSLVLHDLIKYTPEDHVDHKVLLKALDLSQYNLEQIGATINDSGAIPQEKRHLVKSSFLVELVSGQRKVRYIFLFSDILICTKKESSRKGSNYDVKWYVPLCELSIDTHFDYEDDLKHSQKENIEEMKKKIGQLKSDLREEMKKEGSRESKAWSISGMAAARSVEKLKKKIQELEAQLILQMPKLPVKLSSKGKKDRKLHTLLMTTDYEREEWMETLQSLISKCRQTELSMTLYETQVLINSCKDLPQVNKYASVLIQKDEEMCNGTLNVTIHKLNGLVEACDSYCCVEMDSFDHFFMKARTNICFSSVDPSWDEDFELELDGTQTLRVLVYEKVSDKSDRLLGRGALELSKSWLKPNFQEKTISMNDVSLVISVRHTPANRTMRRTPSQQKSAVFGVKISTCARREGKTVPSIVTACIQEVEKRGIDETGIYRVSGVTSDVQRLKKGFDKNVRVGTHMVGDCDIHAVTGMLKLYFRELPEPLFTEAQYTNFVESLRLADKEAQEKCMLSFLHDLPDANYYTIVTLLEHLVRVAKNVKENKMTIYNLATVFGPTLLAPAVKDTAVGPLEMMSKTTEQVMQQSAIVNYFLSLAAQGRSLRKSAQC